jgi:mono/diheme cytochrome c family protein
MDFGRRQLCSRLMAGAILLGFAASHLHAADPAEPSSESRFQIAVEPFLKAYCLDCHGAGKQEAKLDLSGYSSTADVAAALRTWQRVFERLEAKEMPPDDAPRQPSEAERSAVVDWLRALRDEEARRHAGDPGEVPVRRLSNFELDCTIRDLTGVDLRPLAEFPVDPANEAGFDNSGESLTTSPAWLKKYLAAARHVADHLVLKPEGLAFAPHPVVTDTDRDKYCVTRIVDFYRRHAVDYAEYFVAAWRFSHREKLGRPAASLDDFATEAGLSPKYAATVWSALSDRQEEAGPLAELRALWRLLPQEPESIEDARLGCRRMRDFVVETRKQFVPPVDKLRVKGISDGSQPLVLWRNRRLAAGRMLGAKEDGTAARFCRVFPDAFSIAERPPYFESNGGTKGRLLTAGFHLMQGYFRDDEPLCELVLTDEEKGELDGLWRELNFITGVPARQYNDFIFFERAEPPRFAMGSEFDFARSEDKDAASPAKIERLREAYLAKARQLGASDEAIEAIELYFTNMAADIRWVEEARLAAEPGHLAALERFAERAYRRPLPQAERDELLGFYRALRRDDGLDHENALRDCVTSVLISPHFCYRLDLCRPDLGELESAHSRPAVFQTRPLSDYDLASRLSYFLWSSMPDRELLAHAAAGDLHHPDVLLAQSRRMLRDERVWGLATQFAGSFFDFRRFDEHNSVDRQRFGSFTNELRQAMYEEPLRFFLRLAGENGSLLDLFYGDYTFVNPVLARHYGIPWPAGEADGWVRVDGVGRWGRGGLLPMAVFLTKNSPGLRTSPVKRGYWVVSRLLGERIPAPPPSVPELPKDEAALGELTLSQLLARHREAKNCAVCHDRFDSVGLVFEAYGPIGERRDRDLAGHAVSEAAVFRDGSLGSGVDGLRDYLRRCRQDDFVDNFCRKLLVYALGRGALPSDDLLVENMRTRLAADDYRFGSLVEAIVTSPQFLTRRATSE